jgi:hypothetical protein
MERLMIFIALLLAFFSTSEIKAQSDNLQPARGIFDCYDYQFEYYSKIRKVLFKDLNDSPEIRFLVLPSFTPENVLDIQFDRNNEKYYLVFHICEKMIWYNETWEQTNVRKTRKEITKESVELIKKLFETAIHKSKHSEELLIVSDGTNYYFSIHNKTGTVWSPSEGSKMGRLVNIGQKLIQLINSNNELVEFDDNFKENIIRLTTEIK